MVDLENCRELMTMQEVTAILRVCPKTLRRLISDGEIPVVTIRRSKRIRKQDLIDYINNQTQE